MMPTQVNDFCVSLLILTLKKRRQTASGRKSCALCSRSTRCGCVGVSPFPQGSYHRSHKNPKWLLKARGNSTQNGRGGSHGCAGQHGRARSHGRSGCARLHFEFSAHGLSRAPTAGLSRSSWSRDPRLRTVSSSSEGLSAPCLCTCHRN